MKRLILSISAALCSASAIAANLPPIAFLSMGFREVHLADLVGSAHYRERIMGKDGFLSVTADFNGDGKPDEARILVNTERQVAYVVVVTLTAKADTYVLRTLSLAELPNVGIRSGPVRAEGAGLVIFDFAGEATLETFNGDEFDASPLPSGEFPT